MCILTDSHLHTSFSADSDSPMEEMIQKGIALGLTSMCFTEHMDKGVRSDCGLFETDTPAYQKKLLELKEKYRGRIRLLFGIELGLEPCHQPFLREYAASYPFDFIIGSSHVVDGIDPYYPAYFEGKTEEEAYCRYFETIPENLKSFSDVDVYGHLDYIVRYGPQKNQNYSFAKYRDVILAALKILVEKGIGLEINSGGLKYGLGHTNPHPDVLKAYLNLGGEIVTVGSDAHTPQHIAWEFPKVRDMLLACGCRYYAFFRERKPEFIKL